MSSVGSSPTIIRSSVMADFMVDSSGPYKERSGALTGIKDGCSSEGPSSIMVGGG